MKYKIEVTEMLQRVVEVDARDLTEAISKVGKDYDAGGIILDSMDFVGYSIKEAGSECKQNS